MRLSPTKYTTAFVVLATWPDGKFTVGGFTTRGRGEEWAEEQRLCYPTAYVAIHEITQPLPLEEKP